MLLLSPLSPLIFDHYRRPHTLIGVVVRNQILTLLKQPLLLLLVLLLFLLCLNLPLLYLLLLLSLCSRVVPIMPRKSASNAQLEEPVADLGQLRQDTDKDLMHIWILRLSLLPR